MSSESPPARKSKPRNSLRAAEGVKPTPVPRALRLLDVMLLAAFLALTFLLGAFPLKDTDFWWHLRTGDLIRQTGMVPKVDPYTFTVAGKPWIDLHWVFQVAISLVYEWGGVRALTLAKCAVTTFAVFLLVTSRRREWPLWAAIAAWLPALLVLGGRMYVRPETLTLLYLSISIAVLVRIDRFPALALVLPLVQIAWVNTQGLFVLGPILLGSALIDAALRPGAFAPGRKRWWRIVATATGLTGLACLVNPYGLTGAIYPIQLARTMGNPVFSQSIAELTPIPEFIRRYGIVSLPFRLHLLAMALGALSFVVPLVWVVFVRLFSARAQTKEKGAKRPSRSSGAGAAPGWRLSPFRLLLFAAFSGLSWQATRNSHQFAAVVGAVTAWNFGEWAAAVRRRAWEARGSEALAKGSELTPRLVALAAVVAVAAWVGTGRFYDAAGEGRTIGLGEQPLWYPRDAVQFAGRAGMPDRFLGFHIGHASLFEYDFGPTRKVFADARLEVIGPELYERYVDLQRKIELDQPGWPRELDEIGRPVILVDLEYNARVGATLLMSPDWRCVWFDPVAAVFVHASYNDVIEAHAVDFAARHFHPDPASDPRGTAALLASARGLRNLAGFAAQGGPERVRPLVLLGIDHARRAGQSRPDAAEPWKLLGLFEFLREPPSSVPVPRFRMPFDPVFDLSSVRATYALRRSLDAAPSDFLALLMLIRSFQSRGMNEEVLTLLDRLLALTPINAYQDTELRDARVLRTSLQASVGREPPPRWENLSQLNQATHALLASGRARTAADYLTGAAPDSVRTWEETDRIATLRLHLGQTDEARALWRNAPAPPRPALRDARLAFTHLVEGDFETARDAFRVAISSDPNLFEAHYGLAVLEQDAGRAGSALAAARKAAALAANDVARSAAQSILAAVTPYASSRIAEEENP